MPRWPEQLAGRPGPVFIEIPLDVQGKRVEYTEDDIAAAAQAIELALSNEQDFGQAVLEQAMLALLQAKRPLLYIGNGCRITGSEQAAVEFVRGR